MTAALRLFSFETSPATSVFGTPLTETGARQPPKRPGSSQGRPADLSLCLSLGDALAAAKNANRPVVVAVDDSPDFRRVLSLVLTEAGLDVRTAGSGTEALQLLADLTPDLLILDVSMPGMSGYDLCHVIKREERLASIPVVFLSAFGNPQHYKLGHDAGAVVYIVKPFMPERLVNVVSMLVEAGRRKEKKSGVA